MRLYMGNPNKALTWQIKMKLESTTCKNIKDYCLFLQKQYEPKLPKMNKIEILSDSNDKTGLFEIKIGLIICECHAFKLQFRANDV